ncbi:hypothetical protein [Loigolactobacillus backii]|uniref:Uncharacterized protein n=1 Tax=Loigolactobacillus backii TaxID=375175 RepID=A0A192GZ18_9LACO|nr:hypothetical protein [Loigolactobacillus backii]ANK60658.1 hypothetical protein AYR52_10590 [Loigolactobacillus backii]ANK61774.1 hypothetical protein AYR53_02720 [Loigolactobacillus backii]ANK65611.1 hypothetical protein AYR54_10395 [Loigolactobacillus backii]ANK68086.1 hypothetical protein AYR55_10530 [Loigolactobacillus backii]ANK69032.1 hypothetical protein AYR56_02000 [Loigolactobacillus backii]
MAEDRFYQPKDSKDAMRYVENLFNQYKDAPLTDELLRYNQKLVRYLSGNIVDEATREGHPDRAKAAQQMAAAMDEWVRIKALGKPFTGKMKHFKIVSGNQHVRFKARRNKGGGKQVTMRKTMHH